MFLNLVGVKKSKQEGFRSRAVYKLQEINDKHKILKNGLSVIDLGAAPGGWSQFVIQKYKNCKLLSIDLKKMEILKKGMKSFRLDWEAGFRKVFF